TSAQEWTSDPAHGGSLQVEEDYKYDVFGHEIEQDLIQGGTTTTTRFAQDGWGTGNPAPVGNENYHVWADLNGSDQLQTRYLWGDAVDQLFARIGTGESDFWTLTDRQGSVQDVIDNTATVKDTIKYDTWGNIVSESNPAN